jgi:hypothetical protein
MLTLLELDRGRTSCTDYKTELHRNVQQLEGVLL